MQQQPQAEQGGQGRRSSSFSACTTHADVMQPTAVGSCTRHVQCQVHRDEEGEGNVCGGSRLALHLRLLLGLHRQIRKTSLTVGQELAGGPQ